jgi:hypothetical protein
LLPDDWLTPHELEEKRRHVHRQTQIREAFVPSSAVASPVLGASPDSSTASPIASESSPATPSSPVVPIDSSSVAPVATSSAPTDDAPVNRTVPEIPSSLPSPLDDAPLRRSARTNKGSFHSTKYIDEVYLSSILEVPRSNYETELAYHAELYTDLDTGEVNCFDAHAFVAQVKRHDPDNPSYTEAMSGDDAHHYIEAMKQEIYALLQQRTWT